MKTIWKWGLAPVSEVLVPVGSVILDVQLQHSSPVLWALVDTDAPTETRRFRCYGTGHKMPDDPGRYIGTFQVEGLVFHVFEESF